MLNVQTEIEELEKEIAQKKTRLKELKKSVPHKPIQNFEFVGKDGVSVSLLSLFGDKNELILIHNMGISCSYCTMWADGFISVYDYLAHKAPFVLASPDSPAVQASLIKERNWPFPMVSTQNSTFTEDVGFKIDGSNYPGVSTFKRDPDGQILLVANDIFGPGDDYSSPWHFFELLPSGTENFNPKDINGRVKSNSSQSE